MAAATKVRADGLVVVPPDVARDIGVKLGATVTFRTIGPNSVEMTVWPQPPGDARAETDREPSDNAVPVEAQGAATGAERAGGVNDLRPFTLAEMIERFPIEGPIDEADLREGWHDEAAKDVLRF